MEFLSCVTFSPLNLFLQETPDTSSCNTMTADSLRGWIYGAVFWQHAESSIADGLAEGWKCWFSFIDQDEVNCQ